MRSYDAAREPGCAVRTGAGMRPAVLEPRTRMILWPCHGKANQQFYYFWIARHSDPEGARRARRRPSLADVGSVDGRLDGAAGERRRPRCGPAASRRRSSGGPSRCAAFPAGAPSARLERRRRSSGRPSSSGSRRPNLWKLARSWRMIAAEDRRLPLELCDRCSTGGCSSQQRLRRGGASRGGRASGPRGRRSGGGTRGMVMGLLGLRWWRDAPFARAQLHHRRRGPPTDFGRRAGLASRAPHFVAAASAQGASTQPPLVPSSATSFFQKGARVSAKVHQELVARRRRPGCDEVVITSTIGSPGRITP